MLTLRRGRLHFLRAPPPQSLPELSDRATALRARLHTDVMALAARGLISSEPLADLKGPNGYRNVSFDLESIAALLRDNWKDIEDKTAVTVDELDEAETLADQLLTEVGLRDHSTRATVESAAIRQRAYSLFFNTYDQVRRAISYIRWDTRDVDDIAPSLFLARATTRRRGEDEPTPEAPDTLASDRPESTQVEARASTRCSFAGSRPVAREADGPLLFASCPCAVARSVALPRCSTEARIGPRDSHSRGATTVYSPMLHISASLGTALVHSSTSGGARRR